MTQAEKKGMTAEKSHAEEKKRSLKLNIAASMLIQIVSLFINLISKRAIRSCLGMEYLGIQSIYSNFCDVMNFAFLGIGTAMLFSMYGAFARNNQEEIAAYYQYYDKLYQKLSAVVLAGGILCTLLVLYSVNGSVGVMEVCITYLTYLLSVVLYNRQLVRSYLIQADQQKYVAAFITGGVDAVALLAELAVLYAFESYEAFLVCILLKNLLINALFQLYLKKNYPYLKQRTQGLQQKEKEIITGNVKDMVLYRLGKVLISNTDSIFISRFTGTLLVGVYSNYQFIIWGIESMLGAFCDAVKGRIGYQAQTKSLQVQYQNLKKYLYINSWLMGCSMVCFYFLIEDFICLWMGEADALEKSAVILLLVNYYIGESQILLRTYRETAGLFHRIQTVILIKGAANIFLSFVMGKLWGMLGVLAATTISSVFTLFWYEPKIVYQYFKKSVWNEVIYHARTIGLAAVSFGLTYPAMQCIKGTGIAAFFVKSVVCMFTSNLVYAGLFAVWLIKKRKMHEE